MRKTVALLIAVLAIMVAHINVTYACILGFLEEVETPEFLVK